MASQHLLLSHIVVIFLYSVIYLTPAKGCSITEGGKEKRGNEEGSIFKDKSRDRRIGQYTISTSVSM
jgi:hypothetical protein